MIIKIKQLIQKTQLKVCFGKWHKLKNVHSQPNDTIDDDIPVNLKKAYQYFINWKSFRTQLQGASGLELKEQVFKTWRGLLKEHLLSAHLFKVKQQLAINHRASIVMINAFDEWREALDYKRRSGDRAKKILERAFVRWKGQYLQLKVRNKAANLCYSMSTFRAYYPRWKSLAEKKDEMDKLGLVAWYQKLVGDNFISWRKLAARQNFVRTFFTKWRKQLIKIKSSNEAALNHHSQKLKKNGMSRLKQISSRYHACLTNAYSLLETRLVQMQKEKFKQWRSMAGIYMKQESSAMLTYSKSRKEQVIAAWRQSSQFQKAADEHCRGKLLVRGLFYWRAAVQKKVENRDAISRFFTAWRTSTKSRRTTRFYFGKIMLSSVGKYRPSSSSLSILMPSPELSAAQSLDRPTFDQIRNKARCLFLWLHKTRRARSLRQAAVDYRKARFAKCLYEWRAQHLLRNNTRNAPFTLRRQFFKKWKSQSRQSSKTISLIDKKLHVSTIIFHIP
jgi:hypothetical protein